MHPMKFVPLLAGCTLLSLSSCGLIREKDSVDETIGDESIPPPSTAQASKEKENDIPQAELPELSATSKPDDKPTGEVNVKEIDGFVYKNVLDDLPTQRDLATPPASISPSSQNDEGTRRVEDETKPLVANP